jgi:hypothetical protein
MKSTSIRRAAALPHCRYCGRPGTATRHLGRRRRRAMFICERCTWASTLLYNRDGTRTMVFLEEQYNQQIADVGVACFRKHIFLLHSRWSRYCDFCERVGRDVGLVLVGNRRICLRCVIDLYKQMRRVESREAAAFPGVPARDYGFLTNEDFVRPGRLLRPCTDYRIIDGYVDRCDLTFARAIDDGLCLNCLHGPGGLRIVFTIGSRPSPISDESWDVAATPSVNTPVYDLPAGCCFCRQKKSIVAGLGVSERTGATICYECLLMGHDAFRTDGATTRRGERELRRSPVRWVDADTYRPHKSNACEGVRLARIALPQKRRRPFIRL